MTAIKLCFCFFARSQQGHEKQCVDKNKEFGKMTEYSETRIEVEQTAEAREQAILDLTKHDQIEYRYSGAPEGVSALSDLYGNEDGWLSTAEGNSLRVGMSRGGEVLAPWWGDNPFSILLAVIKRTPIPTPADAKPGEVWGRKNWSTEVAVYMPGLGIDAMHGPSLPWMVEYGEGAVRRVSMLEFLEIAAEMKWVKLREGGEEVAR